MELCQPVTLRDGLPLLAFTRHLRGLKEPTSRHTLRYTLGGPVLEQLLAQEAISSCTPTWECHAGPGEELFPFRTGPSWTAWRSISCRRYLGCPHGQGLEPLAHDPASGLGRRTGKGAAHHPSGISP